MNKKYAAALGFDKEDDIVSDKFMDQLKQPEYYKPDYWEERYKKTKDDKTYEWLESYSSIKAEFQENVINKLQKFLYDGKAIKNKDIKILNVGCGNSTMSEDMYDDGFVKNYNIDISKKCIEMMLNRNVFRRPEIEW